jgi:hypothetical protein
MSKTVFFLALALGLLFVIGTISGAVRGTLGKKNQSNETVEGCIGTSSYVSFQDPLTKFSKTESLL